MIAEQTQLKFIFIMPIMFSNPNKLTGLLLSGREVQEVSFANSDVHS